MGPVLYTWTLGQFPSIDVLVLRAAASMILLILSIHPRHSSCLGLVSTGHWPVAKVGRISLYLGMNTIAILGLFKGRGLCGTNKLTKLKEATALVILVLGQYDLGNQFHFQI